MSVGAQQMKWAVLLQMREHAPGTLQFDEADRWGDVCVDDALAAFSRDITTGSLEERVAAVEALGWMLDPRAASPLVRALSDSTPEVRRAAARGFSSFLPGPEWTVDPLLAALNDTDAGVRFYAVGALMRHRSMPEVSGALRRVARDPVALVRQHADVTLRGAYEFDDHASYIAQTLRSSEVRD
jgi:HEAT repeat protein